MTNLNKKNKYMIPADDKSVLIEPSLSISSKLIDTNRKIINQYSFTICGFDYNKLRARIRLEIVGKAENYTKNLLLCRHKSLNGCHHIDDSFSHLKDTPIILTGHAPVFYSPGVWIKNHLVDKLSRNNKGIGINIIIDNDIPGEVSLAVPNLEQDSPSIDHLKIWEFNKGLPYEETTLPSISETQEGTETKKTSNKYHDIKKECVSILSEVASNGTIDKFMDLIIHSSRCTNNFGEQLTFARRQFEKAFDMNNLEIPVSSICETEGFLVFFLAIAEEHNRFAHIYNSRLENYRNENKIRSSANPLPNLMIDNRLTELPFWIWRTNGSRKKVYIQKDGDRHLKILAENSITENFSMPANGATERLIPLGRLSLGDHTRNIEELKGITRDGFKIRPKALTNTLFLRFFLTDLFVHGVGGAKYDIITDGIIEDFYRVTPPHYIAISATLYPPFDKFKVDDNNLQKLENELKQMRHNPDKYIPDELLDDRETMDLVLEKQEIIKRRKESNKSNTREKFLRIKKINVILNNKIKQIFENKELEIDNLRKKLEYNAVINNRNYPFFIYPQEFIREFYENVLST